MSDTPQEVVSVPVSVLRLAIDAITHERFCRACAEDGCVNCNGCTYQAALSALREVVRS
jgi:hypothetical protein